jgi:peptidoglycan hydrolase-like protein with peptidoglycan-binding domain
MLDGTWHPTPPALEAQLLDLATLDAAAQVQRRLQERGFFRHAVDGVWGPRSRIALREFETRNGLGDDDSLTAAVQIALLDDRYRTAALDYVPPEPALTGAEQFSPFPGRSGARPSPLNIGDALTIQRRLASLGYYGRDGDGTWGMASHVALRDFKVANGLPGDDRWDRPTEAALMNNAPVPATATPFGEWAGIGTSCTDLQNPLRLAVSALEVLAGGGICRLEEA